MNFKLIQWHINGFLDNYTDLQLLINEKNPHLLSLQETHCNYLFNPVPPNGFSVYFGNSSCNLTNKQGLGVFIKSNSPHKEIQVNSNFQIIALEVTLNKKLTIISIYLPPSQSFTSIELINIFQNITTPDFFQIYAYLIMASRPTSQHIIHLHMLIFHAAHHLYTRFVNVQ